jgi:hypothetical protein
VAVSEDSPPFEEFPVEAGFCRLYLISDT